MLGDIETSSSLLTPNIVGYLPWNGLVIANCIIYGYDQVTTTI